MSDAEGTAPAVGRPEPRLGRLMPSLLRELPQFRLFFAGQAVSLLGDQISLIALPLVAVLAVDADAAEMGLLGTAALLPNLLLSLHAGAWVDRRGSFRQTMLFADFGRALLIVTIPIAYAFDALTLTQLYLVAFLTGVLSVLFFVSYNTMFVSLVPRERYVEASSLLNGTRAVSYVAGPSMGGVFVQVLTAPMTLVWDAFSFLLSAAALYRLRPGPHGHAAEGEGGVSSGLRWIVHNPIVRASLGATATINYFNFIFFALFVLFATRSLDVAPGVLGAVLGAGAVGGVIGSVVTGPVSRRIGVGPTYIVGCIVFPAPLLLVPLAGGPRWLVLGLLFVAEFGSGLGVMLLDIAGGAIKAALVPDALRARVSGAYMLVNYGVRPLGTLTGAILGSTLGLRPTLWIATAGAVAGFLWLLPSPIPRLRELPEQAVLGSDAQEA
jgi:MFS family permease